MLALNFQAMVSSFMCFPPATRSNYPFQKRTGPRDTIGAGHTYLVSHERTDRCVKEEDSLLEPGCLCTWQPTLTSGLWLGWSSKEEENAWLPYRPVKYFQGNDTINTKFWSLNVAHRELRFWLKARSIIQHQMFCV